MFCRFANAKTDLRESSPNPNCGLPCKLSGPARPEYSDQSAAKDRRQRQKTKAEGKNPWQTSDVRDDHCNHLHFLFGGMPACFSGPKLTPSGPTQSPRTCSPIALPPNSVRYDRLFPVTTYSAPIDRRWSGYRLRIAFGYTRISLLSIGPLLVHEGNSRQAQLQLSAEFRLRKIALNAPSLLSFRIQNQDGGRQ